MKKERKEYRIIYWSDRERVYHSSKGYAAVIAYAISAENDKGRDPRIKYVSCEDGTSIKDIAINYTFNQ